MLLSVYRLALNCAMMGDDLIDQAVFESLLGSHVVVALGILLDLVHALSRILGEDAVQLLPRLEHEVRDYGDLCLLALRTSQRLVYEDHRVRHAVPLALGTG